MSRKAGERADTTSKVRRGASRRVLQVRMSKPAPSANARCGRVALVGRPNVGKSTLLNALVGESLAIVSPHPQTTREPVRGILTRDSAQFLFVDTPGIHTPRTRLGAWMNDAVINAAHDADAIVLVAEIGQQGSAEKRSLLDEDLALLPRLPSRPVVLALSKIDRLRDKTCLLPLLADLARRTEFVATVPLSAKRSDGVDRLLDELTPLLPEQAGLFEADALSDQPQRFFVAELVREQVLSHTRQEVPHGVTVVVERFDEGAKPLRIEASVVVSRETHAGILVGAGGRMVKTIGTAARERIERILGTRVHLELRVRVSPGWLDDEKQLRELGYSRPEGRG